MAYEAKNYDVLLGMNGFSDTLLKNHFKLYQGYVTNINTLTEKLTQLLTEDKAKTPEYAELKRRFGWEFNGMRLHEYYFENMTKDASALDAQCALGKQMTQDFGSTELWKKDFDATSSMRGIGWAILYYDTHAKRLFNVWINEHDLGHLAGETPILIFDVFEHAYMIDYGVNRADYIAAFLNVIHWAEVNKRFEAVA